MRIAFVGKGGSGKTTIAALFAQCLAAHGASVLAIDADINQHLGATMGLSPEETSTVAQLGLELQRIKNYLRGTNSRIASAKDMIKTTPPGSGSQIMNLYQPNPLLSYFERRLGDIRLLTVGAFTEEDLGISCYHSKTGAVELLLNHTVDGPNEYIVVDMTAGADAFASGLFTRFDLTVLIVEPTLKSVSVYRQYKEYARAYDVPIKVLANKIESNDDHTFIQREIGNDVLASVSQSAVVRAAEKGNPFHFAALEPENQLALERMKTSLDTQIKNWDRYLQQTLHFHIRNAESWANSELGKDLREQIDPLFRYTPFVEKNRP